MLEVDAVSNSGTFTTSFGSDYDITWNHTVSGSDRILVVAVMVYNTDPGSVTYNGTALTKSSADVNNGNYCVSIWYLINPDTGNNEILLNFSSTEYGIATAISLTGADQITQPDNTATESGSSGSGNTLSITTNTDGSYLVDGMNIYGPATSFAADGAQTEIAKGAASLMRGGGSYKSVGSAGSQSMAWSWYYPTAQAYAHAILAVRAKGGSASASISLSPSRSPSASQSPSASVSLSPSASISRSPSVSISASVSLSPSASVSLSPSLSISASISLSPSASPSPSSSISLSPSASISLSPSASISLSPSMTPSSSPSVSISLSPSLSPSASQSPSASISLSPSATPSASPSLSPSASPSPSISGEYLLINGIRFPRADGISRDYVTGMKEMNSISGKTNRDFSGEKEVYYLTWESMEKTTFDTLIGIIALNSIVTFEVNDGNLMISQTNVFPVIKGVNYESPGDDYLANVVLELTEEE